MHYTEKTVQVLSLLFNLNQEKVPLPNLIRSPEASYISLPSNRYTHSDISPLFAGVHQICQTDEKYSAISINKTYEKLI